MTLQLLSQFAGPAVQLILVAVLFWVGFLFMRVDKKLNQLRRGTDGVRGTIVELNKAVNNAKDALDNLKVGTASQIDEINTKLEEAKQLSEGLTFLNSVKKNLNPTTTSLTKVSGSYDPRGAEPMGLPPAEEGFASRSKQNLNNRQLQSRSQGDYENDYRNNYREDYNDDYENGARPTTQNNGQYARRRNVRDNDYARRDEYFAEPNYENNYDHEENARSNEYADTNRKTRRERSFSAWNGLK